MSAGWKTPVVVIILLVLCVGSLWLYVSHVVPPGTWIDIRATQLHVGRWEADIPPGWRDINELRKKPPVALIPGSRTLLEENQLSGEITVFPVPAVSGDGCTDLADIMAAQMKGQDASVSGAQGAFFAGDKGCLMSLTVGSMHGVFVIRTRGREAVAVRCLGAGAGLSGTACEKIVYGLRLVK